MVESRFGLTHYDTKILLYSFSPPKHANQACTIIFREKIHGSASDFIKGKKYVLLNDQEDSFSFSELL